MPKVILDFETTEQAQAYLDYWHITGDQDYLNCVRDEGHPFYDNLVPTLEKD